MVLVVKNPPVNAGDVRDIGSIPGSERSLGGEHGNPLQYSCLENPTDRGVWRTTVHRIVKSWTRLQWLSTHTLLKTPTKPTSVDWTGSWVNLLTAGFWEAKRQTGACAASILTSCLLWSWLAKSSRRALNHWHTAPEPSQCWEVYVALLLEEWWRKLYSVEI